MYLDPTDAGVRSLLDRDSNERWDVVMLVQQESVQDSLSFAGNPGYLAGTGHRAAAVEDSRLLPMSLLGLPSL
ncbi:MAG: conserved hypothetical secreted protein [Frankiales bacterium]|nr:conserved hypothetical secreted protein [Frankiales bacterium]